MELIVPGNELTALRASHSDAALGWAEAFVASASVALQNNLGEFDACNIAHDYACERVSYSPWTIAAGLQLLRDCTVEGPRIWDWYQRRIIAARASAQPCRQKDRPLAIIDEPVPYSADIPTAPIPEPKGSR
jgi:hypothetical protein